MFARSVRFVTGLRCALPSAWGVKGTSRVAGPLGRVPAVSCRRGLSTDASPPPAPESSSPLPRNGSPIGWGSVMALVVVGSSFVAYYQYRRSKRLKELELKSIGRPAIGGPFSLVTHRGEPVTDVDFRGQYMLVYFGAR